MPSGMPRHRLAAVLMVAFALLLPALAGAQSAAGNSSDRPAENLLAGQPWEFGPFVNGGFGTGNREAYKFLWAGVHVGKVLTGPFGKGILNGQFELGSEFMPLWQAYTPKYLRANCYEQPGMPLTCSNLFPTGGTYTGLSITPVILRWDFRSQRPLSALDSGCRRFDLDQSQVSARRAVPHSQSSGNQCFQLHPAIRFGLPLLR